MGIYNLKACLFDLDGVIVDTARFHYKAWLRLANELGFSFTEEQNEQLKGVSRVESLNIILGWGGVELTDKEKRHYMAVKNTWYLEQVEGMDESDILDGVLPFLADVQSRNIRCVLGSASKNASTIVEHVGLLDAFDAIVDGNMTERSKPDPEVFLKGASLVGVHPAEAIVFEDAEKGIEAALAGGFYAVGIGDAEVLGAADVVIPNFIGRHLDELEEAILRARAGTTFDH
jgi:beta-phosphoglucomutase